jgi:hypothetical protein
MSAYAYTVLSEIDLLKSKCHVKLAKLTRQERELFPDIVRREADAWRLVIRRVIAELLIIELLAEESDGRPDVGDMSAEYLCLLAWVNEHFTPEIEALRKLMDVVLASPKRKYLRHAMRLRKYGTQELYQSRLLEAMIKVFVVPDAAPEDNIDDNDADHSHVLDLEDAEGS